MYPVCLDITGKLCVVVGGGRVALRKVSGLLEAGACVRVISPEASAELVRLADSGRIEWLDRPYRQGDLSGAFLVFAATDNRQVQETVCQEAEAAGQLVNVVDDPKQCSFHVPAVVRRGELTLMVATGGKSPAVAAMVRRQLEERFGPEYQILLELVSMVREQVLQGGAGCSARKILFQNILQDDIVTWIRRGDWERVQGHLRNILGPDVSIDLRRLKQLSAPDSQFL
ncbi:precorrin-2 dehydrogenase/sirohydrochlorin ferrochelatase family protein [Desulfolithobacter sp.]